MKHPLAQRLTVQDRDQSFPPSEPKDSASLILIDRSGAAPKVLLGKRHHGHKFMPGKFVFPGGRIETGDVMMPSASELHPVIETKLCARADASVPAPRAFALAAVRETAEETGLLLGAQLANAPQTPGGDWDVFAQSRVHPDLANLHFVVRAITPPNRPKRFDTRFFTADTSAIAHRIDGVVGPDSELVELAWVPLTEATKLDIPTITGVILEELNARIAAGLAHDLPVPFYYVADGEFQRDLL